MKRLDFVAAGRGKAIIALIVAALMILISNTQLSEAAENNEANERNFKVVGYYSGDLFNEPVEKLATDKLTHVIYAFLIPNADGTLVPLEKPEQLRDVVTKAHQDGAKVLIALGGWSYKGEPLVGNFEKLAAQDETRNILVYNTCRLLEEYELDGLELNWEHPTPVTIGDYEKLVSEFRFELDRINKEFNAVLYGAWSPDQGPEISQLMNLNLISNFDNISVMAYDLSEAEHSPLWFAQTSVEYWIKRGVPTEKIILGMPLYARPSWKQYRDLVALNSDYAYDDYAPTTPLESYYNGINTLREKTLIALRQAGGVMLFDINEDTNDQYSVLTMIDDIVKRTASFSAIELENHISIIINKREVVFSKEDGYGVPFIDNNNRTMLPIRKVFENLGATVNYDGESQLITISDAYFRVDLPLGKKVIIANGIEKSIDSAAQIIEGRTYIPLREVLEAAGHEIKWHETSKTIYIE